MIVCQKSSFCLLMLLLTALASNPASATEDDDAAAGPSAAEPELPEVTVEDADDEYKSPQASGPAYLAENFDDQERFGKTWIKSKAKKEGIDEDIAKYDGLWGLEEGKRFGQKGNLGLILKSKARHAAIATALNKPFHFKSKPLVVQYEVNFQEGQECGGAYLKLLTVDLNHKDLKEFHDKTPYTIMFGPDKCGNDHKLHFIFRHKNPLNGSLEEKHAKKPKDRLEEVFKDKEPHLYTLIVRPDNSFLIKVDNNVVNEGSLLDDFNPPVNPPLEIEDPNDKRPEDWDDREKIPDPLAVKPDDWDENAPAQIFDENDVMPDGWLEDEPPTIPNPDAVKPTDWDEDMDGDWEPPEIPNPKCADTPGCGPYKKRLISNPNFKGKWLPPLIDNPNYRGAWKPKLIHNPDYFNDEHPFNMSPVFAVGFELWSMSADILFDNILITDDETVAQKYAEDSFEIQRRKRVEEGSTLWQKIVTFTAENPWVWSVYIIMLGIPVMLVIYCCCFTQDKEPVKEYHEESELLPEQEKEEESEAAKVVDENPEENAEEQENRTEEKDKNESDGEAEQEEVEEIMETKKETPIRSEGPRRRKPNKE